MNKKSPPAGTEGHKMLAGDLEAESTLGPLTPPAVPGYLDGVR
ncbi:MAG: hypothetical protein QOH55_1809 [Microbacteriaceae bacterium]|nr:hypothetical protein [Microbacteriaceae bacterium]